MRPWSSLLLMCTLGIWQTNCTSGTTEGESARHSRPSLGAIRDNKTNLLLGSLPRELYSSQYFGAAALSSFHNLPSRQVLDAVLKQTALKERGTKAAISLTATDGSGLRLVALKGEVCSKGRLPSPSFT
jgi:hypothetical protein